MRMKTEAGALSRVALMAVLLGALGALGGLLGGCEAPCEDTLTCEVGTGGGGGAGAGSSATSSGGAKALGEACEDPAECDSGFCADGACCDAACEGACEACSAEGACEPIVAGAEDEDLCPGVCDGSRGCSTFAHRYSRAFRTSVGPEVLPADIVAGLGGEFYLAGYFDGGQLQLGAEYGGDFFVSRFDATGQVVWVESWTLGTSEFAHLGLDEQGGVYLVGSGVTTDGFPMGCTGSGVYLTKLSSSGQLQFCKNVGGTGGLAVLPSGDLAVVSCSGANCTIESFDSSGNAMGQVDLSATTSIRVGDLVASPSGDGFAVAGTFQGTGTFAGHIENASGTSGFVTILNTDLTHRATRTFGTDIRDVVLASGSNSFGLAATFEGGADLGSGEVLSSNRDLLIAVIDETASARWTVRVDAGPGGGANAVMSTAVAIDATDNVAVAGVFRDSIELGRTLPAGSQNPALFIGKLAGTDGTPLQGRSWPQGEHNIGDIAIGSSGEVWWFADASGFLDFGGGEIEVETDTCFLAGFEP